LDRRWPGTGRCPRRRPWFGQRSPSAESGPCPFQQLRGPQAGIGFVRAKRVVTMAAPTLAGLLRRLHRDNRGAASVQCVEGTVVCVLGVAAALLPLGLYLLRYYDHFEFWTGLPLP